MADILRYYESERCCEDGYRHWYLRSQEHILFCVLHDHIGHWVTAEKIEPHFWPARSPDTWRNVVSIVASHLALHIVGTSCHIENIKDSHVNHLGYRLVGDIDWIKDDKPEQFPNLRSHK